MSKKEKFALYLPPELRTEAEEHCQEEGSHSLTAFIEKAVRFYLGYLDAQDAGLFPPPPPSDRASTGGWGPWKTAWRRCCSSRRWSWILCERILADSFELDETYLRRKRAESVESVKRTNGQLRFEQVVRQRDEDEDDDEWLG